MKPHPSKPLVLCEGKEDRLVMEMLAQHAGLEGKLSFQDYGGETNLRRNLATLKVSPEFRRGEYARVLVTRDADSDFNAAWASVTGSLKTVFSCEPGRPGEWVAAEGGVPMTAWVVPGPGQTGMIETLCLDAARSKNPEMFGCLDPFVVCLGSLNDCTPHEKVRFALWTIIAQGKGAQDRLSLDRALAKLDLAWDDEAFAPLTEILVTLAT
jgi:hypothetical protein